MAERWSSSIVVTALNASLEAGGAPKWRQLYRALRQLIIDGDLAAGVRLPATRALAVELGVSRHTVLTAVEQLTGEGYLVGQTGSGTYVNRDFAGWVTRAPQPPRGEPRLSSRGRSIRDAPRSPLRWNDPSAPVGGRAFTVGLPAVDLFPAPAWRRSLGMAWRQMERSALGYRDPRGVRPLREGIADYLLVSRGLACDADQIVIVAGSQAALDLIGLVLLDVGDLVAVEDPGYLGAHGALRANGARLVGVPLDRSGLVVGELEQRAAAARAVYVTPAHQFPTGVTMSLDRRLSLVAWAERHDAWILEDDYDTEFRYGTRPLDPLAVLDRFGRAVYIGTFSKVMFPALRLGYVVAPPGLADAFAAAAFATAIHVPPLEQLALAMFMADGHFARHLQRAHHAHAERRATLLDAVDHHLAGALDLGPADAGLHVTGTLVRGVHDSVIVDLGARRGLDLWPLSIHAIDHPTNGLVLGYGGTTPSNIEAGVRVLAEVIDGC